LGAAYGRKIDREEASLILKRVVEFCRILAECSVKIDGNDHPQGSNDGSGDPSQRTAAEFKSSSVRFGVAPQNSERIGLFELLAEADLNSNSPPRELRSQN
jgi:hypothetical protein